MDSSYSIDIHLRDRIWSIIKMVLQNPEGSAILERDNEEPLTVAINTPRGKAFYAMIAYALWVKRNSSDQVDFNLKNNLPEVQEAILEKLDPNKEPMIALRSLFGRCLPLLITLDTEWTAEYIETIFPLDDQRLFISAIIGYLWDYIKRDIEYRLLKPVFSKAVREFGPEIDQKYSYLRPANRLAEMLAIAILRGINSYDDDTDPITVMTREGHIYLRTRVIESLVHFIYKEDLPSDFVSRAQDYWDRRVASLESADDPNEWQELSDISNWYVSRKFDEDWVLTQFELVVKKQVDIEYSPELIETLNENVKHDPNRVFLLLNNLVSNALYSSNQVFFHLFSYDDATPVIVEAYQKGKEETRKLVKEFSSRMASKTITKYRDAIKDIENEP